MPAKKEAVSPLRIDHSSIASLSRPRVDPTVSAWRFCLGIFCAAALSFASAALAQERVITKAIDVRSLSPNEAELGIPVQLRGVVVFVESVSAIFLQDETSTTFFRLPSPPLPKVGDEIELTGKTRMGLYLPGLSGTKYRVLGRRELPPGIPVHYDDLHFGRYHYQRVAAEGIVRSVRPAGPDRTMLRLAMGSRVIDVRVDAPLPSDRLLVDHRMRITGLAAGQINVPRRQLVQPSLRVVNWDEVETLAPAPPAEDVPQVSAEELLAFQVSGLGEQRVRIAGVVSTVFGEEEVFMQQGAMAFAVRFGRPTQIAPGDRVTIVGFPSMERFSASLVDAELLDREPGPAPAPIDIDSLEELYGKPGDQHPGKHDGRLVRVTVMVRDAFKSEDGLTLLVQGGQRTIQARVPDGAVWPSPGTLIQLTGICQVESAVTGSGFQSRPGLISLRAGSPDALEVLRTPPWWTPRRLSLMLAGLAGVTLLSGLWIAVLRRQVRLQTAALRHRIEAEAALEERQRIAREFHDTLEQELAGVTLRLDALATRITDEKGTRLVTASRNLVSRIQIETRDLISDLRDAAETAGDLMAALAMVAARHSSDGDLEVRLHATTPIPPLPAATVHDLRMIARESVNNARKHGRATCINIEVAAHSGRLALSVVDNGCGFDPTTTLEGKRGHFGCAGMRERGRKIGAEVVWRSALQKGTTVEVTLPIEIAATPAVFSSSALNAPTPAPVSASEQCENPARS
jgi:signal transduction histidine kinase